MPEVRAELADAVPPSPVVAVRGVSKTFPGVLALSGIDVDFYPGEVHGLVGENGAGKSTLVKILAGAYQPDSGEIHVAGRKVSIGDPREAADYGLAFIHQEPQLVSTLSVAENMTLGLQVGHRAGLVRWRNVREAAQGACEEVGFEVDIRAEVGTLSVAKRRLVSIAKALLAEAKFMAFDEPSASLASDDVDHMHAVIRHLVERGVAVVYISHRLDEVIALSSRITVLKDGLLVTTQPVDAFRDRAQFVQAIVGKAFVEYTGRAHVATGDLVLKARDLSWGNKVRGVSFEIRRGELVGLAGLVGSGRSELARLLFGAERPDSGTLEINGEVAKLKSPRNAIAANMALLPEDRRVQGGIMSLSVAENTTLSNLAPFSVGRGIRFLRKRAEIRGVADLLQQLDVRPREPRRMLATLSGGNQQKVLVGKWLNSGATIFVLDEPTQGVDVGARQEMYRIVEDLADSGAAVIMISSEIEDILHVCRRVLVMREGEIVADLNEPSPHAVLEACYAAHSSVPSGDNPNGDSAAREAGPPEPNQSNSRPPRG